MCLHLLTKTLPFKFIGVALPWQLSPRNRLIRAFVAMKTVVATARASNCKTNSHSKVHYAIGFSTFSRPPGACLFRLSTPTKPAWWIVVRTVTSRLSDHLIANRHSPLLSLPSRWLALWLVEYLACSFSKCRMLQNLWIADQQLNSAG